MNVKTWSVCLIEPNKFEGQIILDLLRNGGVERVKVFASAEDAIDALELYSANIIIASFEMAPLDGAAWTRAFRRNQKLANRKAAVFITSGAFSRAMAEQCRRAGANALIGKPISGKVLLATINKVLTRPRPFVEGNGYVGPCRRAGIVTAGAPKTRRRVDADASKSAPALTLDQAVEKLSAAASQFAEDLSSADACAAALQGVRAYAMAASDDPLMRACAAFALQLCASQGLHPDAARAAVKACVEGIAQLAAAPAECAQLRETLAEAVRQAVARAAMQQAA